LSRVNIIYVIRSYGERGGGEVFVADMFKMMTGGYTIGRERREKEL